jgi:hypothetical protein
MKSKRDAFYWFKFAGEFWQEVVVPVSIMLVIWHFIIRYW